MKIYKSISNHILPLFIAAIGFASCEKQLDIFPTQSIAAEKAMTDENAVSSTLIGCYDGIQTSSLYGGDIMVLNEIIGNSTNIRFTGTFAGLDQAYRGEMTSNNSFAEATWGSAYNTINRCNHVLANLEKVTSSPENKSRVEGEALFLRASIYFELVRLYAKAIGDGDANSNPGVPLVLKPTSNPITEADYPSRSSVKQVYDQVVADLSRAEQLLPESNSRYATKWAAAAQSAKVYLTLGMYADARDAADRVIEGSGIELNQSFENLWFTYIYGGGQTPAEYIFSIKVTTQDGTNSLNTYFGRTISDIPGTAGRSDCKVKDAHMDIYEVGDLRSTFFVESGGARYTKKHLDQYGDVPVIRLSELHLIRAEANVREGTMVGADPVDDINAIRARAGLAPLAEVTLDDVLHEKMVELAFEGNYLPEAKRLQRTVGVTPWNSPTLILPIPQREMDVNKNLTQNQGY